MKTSVRILVAVVAALVSAAPSAEAQSTGSRELCVGGEGRSPLRLRAGPSTGNKIVGSLPAGACGIRVAGKCASGWCEIELNGSKGWADSRFVVVREGSGPARASSAMAPTPPSAPSPAVPRAPAPEVAAEAVDNVAGEPPVPSRKPPAVQRPSSPARAKAAERVEEAIAEAPATRRERRLARRAARLERRGPAYLPPMPSPRAGLGGPAAGARTACVVRVWPGDTLRLRNGPGPGHPEIVGIRPGSCNVAVRGGCIGAWCRVDYRGARGWVNAYYLQNR